MSKTTGQRTSFFPTFQGVFLLVLFLLLTTTLSCAQDTSSDDDMTNNAGMTRVIVAMDVPDYEDLLNAAQKSLDAKSAEERLSAAIAETAASIADSIPSGAVTLIETFRVVPSAIFEADAEGLRQLKAHELVRGVQEDEPTPLAAPSNASSPGGVQ